MIATRLSRIHPYPAMVADELAVDLIDRFVAKGDQVIDPFCGSGRLVAAAAQKGARCIGVDVNPLACLITASKVTPARVKCLQSFRNRLDRAKKVAIPSFAPDFGSAVKWYSKRALCELSGIIDCINEADLRYPERLVVATALSAAAREASYCRLHSWKLHRMDATDRRRHVVSPLALFARRLDYYISEAPRLAPLTGSVDLLCGDVRLIKWGDESDGGVPKADLVITSPPYGDSLTTVQYGAASALCLDVVRHIVGLEHLFRVGKGIDNKCLGSTIRGDDYGDIEFRVSDFWAGSVRRSEFSRLSIFLLDFDRMCKRIAVALKPKGRLVLILGERSLGGFRVRLGRFAMERIHAYGLRLASKEERQFKGKRTPGFINRFGGSSDKAVRAKGIVRTMDRELVLSFVK